MKVKEVLTRTQDLLQGKTGTEARLEAELLLRHHLGLDRSQFYLALEQDLVANNQAGLDSLLARRLQGEPLAYILGHREFYGLDLLVGHGVLIPRPETELLVEQALSYVQKRFASRDYPVAAADVGTGSGAIAITLATQLPQAAVVATDISSTCLMWARQNALRHQVSERIHLVQADRLHPIAARFDLIVANLPYVKHQDWLHLPDEIRLHEPSIALLGGVDGLELIRRFLSQAPAHLKPRAALFLEIGADQGEAVKALAEQSFPQAQVVVGRDWGSLDRVVSVET